MGISIEESLINLFESNRIVFWHDYKNEMRDDFLAIEIDNVEKVEVKNDEYYLKYKILREQSKQKFLIYKCQYDNQILEENWLHDVELYSGIFTADKVKLWMNELDLEPYFIDVVKEHKIFFNSEKRKSYFKSIIKNGDSIEIFKKKILLSISESEDDIEGLISALLKETFLQKQDKMKLIKKCNIDKFMWDLIEKEYNYSNKESNFYDFALQLFNSNFQFVINQKGTLNENSILLFQRWKNNRNNYEIFNSFSDEFEDVLNIKENINKYNYKELLECDFFKEIDRFIIKSLIKEIQEKTISNSELIRILQERRKTYWYKEFNNVYQTILYASEFLFIISNLTFEEFSFEQYIEIYSSELFKIDQLYRKFIFYYQKSSQPTLLGDINNLVENKYVNDFLFKINNNFQKSVDQLNRWNTNILRSQRSFYKNFIQEISKKGKKSIVVISDAFRFEIGDELNKKIENLDNFSSKIIPLITSLPSYTQICMASLLPSGELGIPSPSNTSVTHNNDPTSGIINRTKILNKVLSKDNPFVSKVPEFLNLNSIECKKIIKKHNVIYLYHDRIDATGDSKKTEGNVFEAVEDSLEELIKLVQKIGKSGSVNIFVTADHGFIYQNREIQESDYLSARPEAEEIFHSDRRFIIGKNFKNSQSFKKFTAKELNIKGNFEVLFPKSINRLRKSGSGSRFVHGGISLQEIIVPVVKVTKSKIKDSNPVGVTILTGASKNITTSQISIKLYQECPIDKNNISRTLLIGLFSKDKKLISNQVEIDFISTSDNTREREQTIKLTLTKSADEYNNQEVTLKLDEKYKNTSYFQTYKSTQFIIKRTFTNDFDF